MEAISEDRFSIGSSFHSAATVLRDDYFGTRSAEMSLDSEDGASSFSPDVEDALASLSDDDFVNVGALDDSADGENF